MSDQFAFADNVPATTSFMVLPPVEPRGLAGLGDAGNTIYHGQGPGPFVSDQAADFLEYAKASVNALRAKAEAIGPPGWVLTSGYGEKWTLIYDAIARLIDEGRATLPPGSPGQAEFLQTMIGINNAATRIRNEESHDAWNAFLAIVTGNPLLAFQVIRRGVQTAGEVGAAIPPAAGQVYGGALSDAWEKIKQFLDTIGTVGKVGAGLTALYFVAKIAGGARR